MMRLEYLEILPIKKMISPPPYIVQIVDWNTQHQTLAKLRTDVFVLEQNVPLEIVMDGLDAGGVHVAAFDTDGNIIGTARLILDRPVPRIGFMAVVKARRGAGVGGQMLATLCDAAKQHGFAEVMVHSQTHAAPFYYQHGFLSLGSEFFEAGIPHQEMHKRI